MGRLDAVSWRIDYTLSSSELREVNEPVIQLKLQTQGAVSGPTETTVVSVSADKFRVLLAGWFCILSTLQFFSRSAIIMLRQLYYHVLIIFALCVSAELKQAQAMMNALQ